MYLYAIYFGVSIADIFILFHLFVISWHIVEDIRSSRIGYIKEQKFDFQI